MHMQPNKLLLVTRHVDKDLFYQAELIELHGLFVWAISFGNAAQSVTITGEAESAMVALSQMRNTLLIKTDVANDILIDVKSTIEQIQRDADGL